MDKRRAPVLGTWIFNDRPYDGRADAHVADPGAGRGDAVVPKLDPSRHRHALRLDGVHHGNCGNVDVGPGYSLRTPKFAAPLLAVDIDGAHQGTIAFAPYELDLGGLPAGQRTLDITAFGSRVNAFGALHNWDDW